MRNKFYNSLKEKRIEEISYNLLSEQINHYQKQLDDGFELMVPYHIEDDVLTTREAREVINNMHNDLNEIKLNRLGL